LTQVSAADDDRGVSSPMREARGEQHLTVSQGPGSRDDASGPGPELGVIAVPGVIAARGSPGLRRRPMPGRVSAWPGLRPADSVDDRACQAGGRQPPSWLPPSALLRRAPTRPGQEERVAPTAIRRIFDPDSIGTGKQVESFDYIKEKAAGILANFATTLKAARNEQQPIPVTVAIDLALDAVSPPPSGPDRLSVVQMFTGLTAQPQVIPALQPADAVLVAAVRALNSAERESHTFAVLGGDKELRGMKIGTEFTFSDGIDPSEDSASAHLASSMPKAPKNESQEDKKKRESRYNRARTRAQECIEQWTAAAVQGRKNISGEPMVTVATYDKGKAPFAKKVTYRIEPNWEWYWIADIDEACYETQTEPTAVLDLEKGRPKEIIEKHIFGGAATLNLKEKKGVAPEIEGLTPDPTQYGGGGHLTFDVGSAFGNADGVSLELLLTTLIELQRNAQQMASAFRTHPGGRPMTQPSPEGRGEEPVPLDFLNAPSLQQQQLQGNPGADLFGGYVQRLSTEVKKVRAGGAVDLKSVHAFLTAINKRLYNPAVESASDDAKENLTKPEHASHYQAVNIEHLAKDSPRIEIRDVPAQTDYKKFLHDLDILKQELIAARAIVARRQAKRLT
jgi:hypothetical protein